MYQPNDKLLQAINRVAFDLTDMLTDTYPSESSSITVEIGDKKYVLKFLPRDSSDPHGSWCLMRNTP